mmetsp:Transcript_27157/g.64976  ORF Transcript_27157/g.64976 Transcript_27157/m.64976 type:complete len:458 (-) Transcript_27157:1212-2585(-)
MVRSLPLERCRFDVDDVDASYSLDERRRRISGDGDSENETNKSMLPSIVSGIVDNESTSSSSSMCQLVVEHCIASGEDQRMRCFALYGSDGGGGGGGAQNNLSLIRVVVGSEERVGDDEIGFSESSSSDVSHTDPKDQGQPQQGLTAADLFEMQSDVDRLVDRISANIQGDSSSSSPPSSSSAPSQLSQMDQLTDSLSNNQEGSQQLTPHDISLLEISSGVWLGDAVVRSLDNVSMSATPPGKGFGSSKPADGTKASKKDEPQGFASWAVGVQKLAVRWMWNFGDDMRQIVDAGKALGSPLGQPLLSSLAGGVYVDESLSRRVSKSERMVYVGYPTIDSVGFLVGCYSVNVPRYVTIKDDDVDDSATSTGGRSQKPFYTEFSVFQEACNNLDDAPSNTSNKLADLVCSKSQRLYNFEGELKQGVTSFYSFSRFGGDSEEADGDDGINDLLDDEDSFL